MRVILDTSVAVAFRDNDPHILRRAAPIHPVALISILTVVELEGGVTAAMVDRTKRRAALDAMYDNLDILPFGMREAVAYRRIVQRLGFSRAKIIDRMIAAQALVADATLATLDPRDVRDIPGLKLADWSA